MRRSAIALITAILLLGVLAVPGAASTPIRLFVDGREIVPDVAPVMIESRTLVPVRAVAEALGGTVQWNASTQTVTILGTHSVSLTIGKTAATVNGKPMTLDVPAQLLESRTFVPVRFVGEAFGFTVAWDAGLRAVKLSSKPAAAVTPPVPVVTPTKKTCWQRGEAELAGRTDFPTVFSYSLAGSTLTAINNGTVGTYKDPSTGRTVTNRTKPEAKLTTTLSLEGVPTSFCAGETIVLKLIGGGDGGVISTADVRIADNGPAVNLLKSTRVSSWENGSPGYTLPPGTALQRGKYVQDPSQVYTLKIEEKARYADPPVSFRLVVYASAGTTYEVAVSWVYTPGEADRVNPVVFIPGVTGSQLMALDGHILWPPGGPDASLWSEPIRQDFERLSLDPAKGPHQAIVPTDVIRTNGSDQYYAPILDSLAAAGYQEYAVGGDPRRRTTAGCDLTQKAGKPKLFVFAYDWRMSNVDSARALKEYVGCVQRFYPDMKVDIVAHSMGGMVARRYIIDNPGKVGRLVTVATPWLGSPKPLYQMLIGTTGTGWSDFAAALAYSQELRNMLAYFPGIHELMASPAYFDLGGRPYSRQKVVADEMELATHGDLVGALETMFTKPAYTGKTPAQNNLAFHSYSAGGNAQDDWRNDTTGVRYFHIVGVQGAENTPLTLREKHTMELTQLGDFGGPSLSEEVVTYGFSKWGAGDGTVPRASAERKGASGANLNAPGATVLTLTGGQGPCCGDDNLLEHTGMMTNPYVMTKVLEFLKAQ